MTPITLTSANRLPATRFTLKKSGGHNGLPYPWGGLDLFTKKLDKGYRVLGWCINADLPVGPRRYEGPDGKYGRFIAVMFEDADGWEYWWHMGDYLDKYEFC